MEYSDDVRNFIQECSATIDQLGNSKPSTERDYIIDALYNKAFCYGVLDEFKELLKECDYPEYSNLSYIIYIPSVDEYIMIDNPSVYNSPFCGWIGSAKKYETPFEADQAMDYMKLSIKYDILAIDEKNNVRHIVEESVN